MNRQLYREPEVSDVIKLKRLQWTGLVLTMQEQRGPRRRNDELRQLYREPEVSDVIRL